jgi:hypothetical protein
MAKDYFGSVLPMQRVSNPLTAIGMVREAKANFAVVPWPADGDENPWWYYLMTEENDRMRIVVRLPYGDVREEPPDQENMALIVSRISYDETGDDRSFLAIETDQSISRGRIVEIAKKVDIEAVSMCSRKPVDSSSNGTTLHLVEVEGFVSDDDKRLKKLSREMSDRQARVICVGGYPKPPVYENIEDLIGPSHKKSGK